MRLVRSADYLGLTLETVSRVLSRLQRAGVLNLIGPTRESSRLGS